MTVELERLVGKNVAVVNSAMQFIDLVDWTKAVTLIVSEEAYTLIPRSDGSLVRSPSLAIPFPVVVGLNKYVQARNTYKVVDKNDFVSKRTILIRDDWTCQYCNKYGNTIDHIHPKSRGGKNTWGNMCVSCFDCNSFKSNKTPEEVGFTRPTIPKVFLPKRVQKLQNEINESLAVMTGV